jgi:hypothetical protein
MSRSRKPNRDHAKQQQRPMLEDEVVAAQLEALVTPALIAQERYYRQWQNERANTNSAIDGGGSDRALMAGCSFGQRTDENLGQRRIFLVSADSSKSASTLSKIPNFASGII